MASQIEEKDAAWLTSMHAVEHRLEAGQVHVYRLDLSAGDYLAARVEQHGIDVVLNLFEPHGDVVASFDSPTQNQGSERLEVVATSAGVYRLEIATAYRRGERGHYRIVPRSLRPASHEERLMSRYQRVKVELHRVAHNHASRHEHSQAPALLLEMIQLAREAGDREAEVWAWSRLGSTYLALEEPLEALVATRKALRLWQDLGNLGMEAHTYRLIGLIYAGLGETQHALDLFGHALEVSVRAPNKRWSGYVLESLGQLHDDLGNHDQVLGLFERALHIWRQNGLLDLELSTSSKIARLHVERGRPGAALDLYRQALPLSEASVRHESTAKIHFAMAEVLASQGRASLARSQTRKALASLRHSGEYHEMAFHRFWPAVIDEKLGRVDAALAGYRSTVTRLATIGKSSLVEDALSGIARLEARRGRFHEAAAALEAATNLLEEGFENAGGERFRALFLASRHDVYERWIDVLLRLGVTEPVHRQRAFEVHERSLARGLLAALARRREVVGPADQAERARLRELRVQIGARVVRELRPAADREAPTQAQLADLLAEHEELVDRARRPHDATALRPLTLQEIQQRVLDPDTFLLAYALGERQSSVWVVTARATEHVELPGRARLGQLAQQVYDWLTEPGRLTFADEASTPTGTGRTETGRPAVANELGRMLLMPLLGQLAARPQDAPCRVVVVADETLQSLPFAALPLPDGSARPLGWRCEVVHVPSASVIDALRQRRVSRQPRRMLSVVADPVLRPRRSWLERWRDELGLFLHGRQLLRAVRDIGLTELAPLPGAKAEASHLAALVAPDQRQVLRGFAASRERLLAGELSDSRYVHIATHALFNDRHPDLSGIVLSLFDEHDRPRDGLLRPHDVGELGLTADLVVLSACQTALGRKVRGEGLMGLSRAFLAAGTPAVVASLWSPNDQATAELMKLFYTALLTEQLAPATALRQAQMAVAGRAKWRHPYFWAPFVLQGDWRHRRPAAETTAASSSATTRVASATVSPSSAGSR